MLSNELKQNPFGVPDNYFESLQERVAQKTGMLNKELKANPFSVPDNYFEALQERVAERVFGTMPQVVVAKHRSWRSQLAFAASFALLAVMGYGTLSLLSKPEQAIQQHAEDDIYALLKTVSPNMSNASILDVMLNDAPATKTKVVKNGAKDDAIINYLADANLSIYDIAAALE